MAFPIWFVGGVWIAAVAATMIVAARSGVKPIVIDVLLTVEFTLLCWGTKIWPPTGDQMGWLLNARTTNVALSEPLADFVHKIPYLLTHHLGAVRYVSPVFGTLTIICFLVLARRISALADVPLWIAQSFFTATPLLFWFVTGYTENTFLAIPAVLLALHFLLKWLAAPHLGRRPMIIGFAFLALAAAFHVEFVFLLGPGGLFLLMRSRASVRDKVVDLAAAVLTGSVTIAVVLGVIVVAGGVLTPGNSGGGYDGDLFVPFSLGDGPSLSTFTFFSHAHLIQAANIAVHAAPALVIALPVVMIGLVRQSRRGEHRLTVSPAQGDMFLLLAVLSLGYLLFVSIWGFDLGPVGDLDLMLTMDVPLGLAVFCAVARGLARRPGALVALIAVSTFVNIAFYSMKVANVWIQ